MIASEEFRLGRRLPGCIVEHMFKGVWKLGVYNVVCFEGASCLSLRRAIFIQGIASRSASLIIAFKGLSRWVFNVLFVLKWRRTSDCVEGVSFEASRLGLHR